jgi:hypothetical protein
MRAKNWLQTFSMSANDPEFDKMVRLGLSIARHSVGTMNPMLVLDTDHLSLFERASASAITLHTRLVASDQLVAPLSSISE